ncbi:hypothetical protein DPMN_100084 [Dreissena polymorpha]|uniref:Uncharacterized protein n=1 Tax=Dreissena polymorpha TaxID=45954 RepID=A0A9D4R8B8_DREPO|nr:hypothetical protein DPMN_100084 [Dreissena polymorpha]
MFIKKSNTLIKKFNTLHKRYRLLCLPPGLRFLDSNTGATQADEATAFIYKLSDIDIYSNTWGSPDIGIFVDQLPDVVKAAFEEGVQSVNTFVMRFRKSQKKCEKPQRCSRLTQITIVFQIVIDE